MFACNDVVKLYLSFPSLLVYFVCILIYLSNYHLHDEIKSGSGKSGLHVILWADMGGQTVFLGGPELLFFAVLIRRLYNVR